MSLFQSTDFSRGCGQKCERTSDCGCCDPKACRSVCFNPNGTTGTLSFYAASTFPGFTALAPTTVVVGGTPILLALAAPATPLASFTITPTTGVVCIPLDVDPSIPLVAVYTAAPSTTGTITLLGFTFTVAIGTAVVLAASDPFTGCIHLTFTAPSATAPILSIPVVAGLTLAAIFTFVGTLDPSCSAPNNDCRRKEENKCDKREESKGEKRSKCEERNKCEDDESRHHHKKDKLIVIPIVVKTGNCRRRKAFEEEGDDEFQLE